MNESDTLFSGGRISDWDPSRDPDRIRDEYTLHVMEPAASGHGLVWRFATRSERYADLFLRRTVDRPFGAIRLRVQMTAGAPCRLSMKVGDEGSAEWTPVPVDMQPGGERTITFPVGQWQVAPWSADRNNLLDYPLRYLAVILFDVQPSVRYELVIRQVEVVWPEPIAVSGSINAPASVRAGEALAVNCRLSLPAAWNGSVADVTLRDAGGVRFPLGALTVRSQQVSGAIRAIIPWWATPGVAHLEAHIAGSALHVAGRNALARLRISARPRRSVRARVTRWGGAPTLFIDGVPHTGISYAAYGPNVSVFKEFAQAGVRLFEFIGTPTDHIYGLARTAWKAEDHWDFTQMDERASMVLQACPDALLLPRIYLGAPEWWIEQHPDDVVQYDPGDGRPAPQSVTAGRRAPSWASPAWRRAVERSLGEFIKYVQSRPWGDRVIGYHLVSGTTEEWMMWGANEDAWADYSPAAQHRFREWLTERYHTDSALQKAWAAPDVSLAAARLPTRQARAQSGAGWLRQLPTDQSSVDAALFLSDLTAEAITWFAQVVRRLAGPDKIIGVFYGYLLQLCGEQRQQNAGHMGLERVLRCPHIDSLCSPTSYAFRQIGGEGTPHFMSLQGSVAQHGKLWFNENDVRTSVSGGEPGEWGRPRDVTGDLLQQDKELAHAVAQAAAQWWFDVGNNRYDHPQLMQRIKEWTAAATEALTYDRTPADQSALIVDAFGPAWLRVGDPMGAWPLIQLLPELHRAGAPVGHYLASDLKALERHRLFVFSCSLCPEDAQRAAVQALRNRPGVSVFLSAAGAFTTDGGPDATAASAFTGMELRWADTPPGPPAFTDVCPALRGVSINPALPGPRLFVPADPAAEVWVRTPDGTPVTAVKRTGAHLIVYSAAPLLPAAFWREMMKHAGVHLYLDTPDVVHAAHGLLAVSVKEPGRRTIRLPRSGRVTDLLTGRTLGTGSRVTVEFAPLSSRLLGIR